LIGICLINKIETKIIKTMEFDICAVIIEVRVFVTAKAGSHVTPAFELFLAQIFLAPTLPLVYTNHISLLFVAFTYSNFGAGSVAMSIKPAEANIPGAVSRYRASLITDVAVSGRTGP